MRNSLRTLRIERGFKTQKDLAEKSGISLSCVSYIEQSGKSASIYVMNALANVLGLKGWELIKLLEEDKEAV